ncbi:MAG TPA: LuxR C-terminal-related transcriptional regulator [Thermodesulfovibrionales bacterium]|nr:LuxR C-terminal-related transcriptional regulator [Thermodesulfovibrionales bacterium]
MEFLMNMLPLGVFVFDENMGVVYCNRNAEKFINRYEIPQEITSVGKRMLKAFATGRMKELFPGEIYIYKKFDDSPSSWTFKLNFYERTRPFVCVFFTEDALSSKLSLNEIRSQYRLTRREMDVLRRMLNGDKNTEIAEDLQISEQTVKDHLSNIYMKCGAENRFALLSVFLNLPGQGVSPDSGPVTFSSQS